MIFKYNNKTNKLHLKLGYFTFESHVEFAWACTFQAYSSILLSYLADFNACALYLMRSVKAI